MSPISGLISVRDSLLIRIFTSLPQRTKRLVFFASLVKYFSSVGEVNRDVLRKLNEIMILCNNENAMELPVQLSNVIWHGQISYEFFNVAFENKDIGDDEIQTLASKLIALMPSWLHYDDDTQILSDLEKLFRNASALRTI